jgi:hypothetical protein
VKPPAQKPTSRGRAPNVPRPDPWKPAEWEPEDAYAVQAVMRGTASEDQQRRAMVFIVNQLCGTYDLSYRPSGDRDTAFAEGKRFVGLQMVKFANINIAALRGKQTEQGETPKEQPT